MALKFFSGVVILVPFYIKGLPDLETWHTETLKSENTPTLG